MNTVLVAIGGASGSIYGIRLLNVLHTCDVKTFLVLSEGAKKITIDKKYYVVGESETHGNDHRVEVSQKVTFFMLGTGLFMKNEEPTKVYCPKSERHHPIKIPAGFWEVDKAQEFDYVEMVQREVID